MSYGTFVVPLVKAVQELDHQNTALADRISDLEEANTKQSDHIQSQQELLLELAARIEALENQ